MLLSSHNGVVGSPERSGRGDLPRDMDVDVVGTLEDRLCFPAVLSLLKVAVISSGACFATHAKNAGSVICRATRGLMSRAGDCGEGDVDTGGLSISIDSNSCWSLRCDCSLSSLRSVLSLLLTLSRYRGELSRCLSYGSPSLVRLMSSSSSYFRLL